MAKFLAHINRLQVQQRDARKLLTSGFTGEDHIFDSSFYDANNLLLTLFEYVSFSARVHKQTFQNGDETCSEYMHHKSKIVSAIKSSEEGKKEKLHDKSFKYVSRGC